MSVSRLRSINTTTTATVTANATLASVIPIIAPVESDLCGPFFVGYGDIVGGHAGASVGHVFGVRRGDGHGAEFVAVVATGRVTDEKQRETSNNIYVKKAYRQRRAAACLRASRSRWTSER